MRGLSTRTPVLRVALLATAGVIRSHLIDVRYRGALCGAPAHGALAPLEAGSRVTCERCQRWADLLPPAWTAHL